MLGAIAQFETEVRAEQQRDGIQKAKERVVKFGKRKKLNPQQAVELQERRRQDALIKTLMKDHDLSKSNVYRYLNQKAEVVKEHLLNICILVPRLAACRRKKNGTQITLIWQINTDKTKKNRNY